jgi:hypothetical protein
MIARAGHMTGKMPTGKQRWHPEAEDQHERKYASNHAPIELRQLT